MALREGRLEPDRCDAVIHDVVSSTADACKIAATTNDAAPRMTSPSPRLRFARSPADT
jgi:hypothetical protein